jgi:hypothetical protein
MSGRGSKREPEGSTLGEPEKKRMCQEAERGQQGKITLGEPEKKLVCQEAARGQQGNTTHAEDEKKLVCQQAARGKQGNTTQWDPLRQDVSRYCGKGIFALIGVLEKHMKDKCDEVHSAITAGDHKRLQQACSDARGMVVNAWSQFFTHVRDNRLPEEVDEQSRAAQEVIKNVILSLPKFEQDEIVQVVRALAGLLVR